MSFRSRVSKILAQIAFICHIFHVPIFHIYHLALKALRTRSYMACQARNISGRNPFSCKELRIGLLISGFFQPTTKCKSKSFVLLVVGSVASVAFQVVPFALLGHSTLETGFPLLHPETVLRREGKVAQRSSGSWKKAWSQPRLLGGCPSARTSLLLCASLITAPGCLVSQQNQNAAQPVSHTISIPDFSHYRQAPYQENTRLCGFCLIWPLIEHVIVKIQSCRSYTSLSRVDEDTFWNEILVPAPIFPNEKVITHTYSLILA